MAGLGESLNLQKESTGRMGFVFMCSGAVSGDYVLQNQSNHHVMFKWP